MTRHYCTYFDANYLVRAIALIESLHAQERQPYRLFAICLDEISRLLIERLNLPNVVPIPLHRLERQNERLAAARRARSLVEYYWTLTPTVLHWLFEEYPDVAALTYLDADLYFFSSPEPIFEEFNNHSVLIHEHRFPAEFSFLETYGKFNVGLLCFRRDEPGLEVLEWWRQQCLEWCYARLDDGKFGDQLYLNDWPERFCGVRVLQHIGGGVAPWNHNQYTFGQTSQGDVTVNGLPLIFFHFHGLKTWQPDIFIPAWYQQYNPVRPDILRYCFLPYIKVLYAVYARLNRLVPGSTFGFQRENSLPRNHTIVCGHRTGKELSELLRVQGIPADDVAVTTPEWKCLDIY